MLALMAPTFVMAEIEATVEVRNETSVYTQNGQKTGEASTMLDTNSDKTAGDLMKFQNQAKVFLNGGIGDDSSWHAELQIIYDSEGTSNDGGMDYRGHKNYTQNDYFRELYMDTELGGWAFRIGKQQVVWGTADGIKLLDIINPTDFRELNQNVMEHSRLPIWMINAETSVGDNGNFQFVISEVERNKIPGLNSGDDSGHPFLMKGVDSITGNVNGFMSIAPNLSNVAGSFNTGAMLGAFAASGAPPASGLVPFTSLTVDGFANGRVDAATVPGAILMPGQFFDVVTPNGIQDAGEPGFTAANAAPGYAILNGIAQYGLAAGDPRGNYNTTNLMTISGPALPGTPGQVRDVTWNSSNPMSAFEYMSNATFATFNSFTRCTNGRGIGCGTVFDFPRDNVVGGVQTQYVQVEEDDEANAGFRWKANTDSGINYSLNYFYHYGANPQIDLSWHDARTGEELQVRRAPQIAAGMRAFMPNTTRNLTPDQLPNTVRMNRFGMATNSTTMLLRRPSDGAFYGAIDPSTGGLNANSNGTILRFTESLYRVHSLGASFDMAIDSTSVPLVVRGEFLYDHDEKQPVIDKRLLAIGDLSNSLTMQDADMFKYVLGLDATVMTNLLISGQFIQFINLDYIDEGRANCRTQFGRAYDCDRYTADFATMHLTNGFNKAEEHKEFVSLFFSKPIGEDQLGRWNNITIWEEGGGWWNRLNAEYSVTDQFIVSGEWNHYWGDENTTFGQFDESSNVQVGFKYIFEDY